MTDIRLQIEVALTETLRGDIPLAMDCADVIMSMPGVAIVELPESESIPREWATSECMCLGLFGDVAAWEEGEITDETYKGEFSSSEQCRAHAAALLAAADRADGK